MQTRIIVGSDGSRSKASINIDDVHNSPKQHPWIILTCVHTILQARLWKIHIETSSVCEIKINDCIVGFI